ncbi:MAG: NUDIX hydrolase [Planctomycetota bacterium]
MNDALTEEQQLLLAELEAYQAVDATEEEHRRTIRAQVLATPLWWHRDTLPGHVTASAFVVTPTVDAMLLHHHRKLDRWLQFGGHDEGERHPAKTVLRELAEESGLQHFDFFGSPTFFDLDVHPIPAIAKMEAHLHLDVRFLFTASRDQELRPGDGESEILQWFSIAEAERLLDEEGGGRVCRKLQTLCEAL